jgi:hypothetical protein
MNYDAWKPRCGSSWNSDHLVRPRRLGGSGVRWFPVMDQHRVPPQFVCGHAQDPRRTPAAYPLLGERADN